MRAQRLMRGALLALALMACSSPPQDLPAPVLPERVGIDETVAMRAEGVRYLATGDAPFVLRIYDDHIALARAGEGDLNFPQSEPIYPRWNGEIFDTEASGHRLRVEIRHRGQCGGDDARDTVKVTLDGAVMTGCGRAF
jgi:hypothetical protein